MSYQPASFTLDICKQPLGAHLGGDCGKVIACPICSKPCCMVKKGIKKGKPFAHYAHAVSITSGCASKPEQSWENLCVREEERGH